VKYLSVVTLPLMTNVAGLICRIFAVPELEEESVKNPPVSNVPATGVNIPVSVNIRNNE